MKYLLHDINEDFYKIIDDKELKKHFDKEVECLGNGEEECFGEYAIYELGKKMNIKLDWKLD